MFDRDIEKKALALATKFPVIGILGPRQSGKTTLAQKIFPSYTYVSLEDPQSRLFAEQDPKGFLETHMNGDGIVLDEVQHVPDLFSYIQLIVDETQQPGSFILTGSQNFLLHEKLPQTLAGRIALLTLLPLSIDELKRANRLPDRYEALLFQGGYPRIHAQNISPQDWYPNYLNTYVERDIRELRNVANLTQFQRFIKLCAGRVGQLVNFSDLGRDAGLSFHTVKEWLSLLETSYILFFLQPYHKNFHKRLVKSPKLYFYDMGLTCSLLGINSVKDLDTHYLKGNLFESLIVSELLKMRYHRGLQPNVYFWRDKVGHELNCLVEKGEELLAVEIKSGKTLTSDFFTNIHYWQKLTDSSPSNSYLIYGGHELQKRSYSHVLGWQNLDRLS
ncbi:MAG: hypothetical protein K940chlam9_00356 [Chlamydiae bacterium]|nr:hypothetical protein [Chlamydiota bacterium]